MKSLLIIFLLVVSVKAHAKYAGAEVNQIPTASVFPATNAILFPSAVSAAGVNASALGLFGKRTDLQAAYSRGGEEDPQGLFAGTELGSNGFGVGLGYLGQKYSSTKNMNNMYGGLGFKLDPLAFGLGVRNMDSVTGSVLDFDFSMMTSERKGVNFGFVLYNTTHDTRQLDLGLGYAGGRKFNMEVNVLLPPFTNSNSQGYVFTGAATLYGTDWLAFSGRVSYKTSPADLTYMLGATTWITDTFNLFLFYTAPRVITGGVTFSF